MELMNKLKYNYVICGAGGYYNFGYRDIMNLPNVRYYSSYTDCVNSTLQKLLVCFNFSAKVNRIVKTPLSKIVYPHIYKADFKEQKPLCYVFFGNVQYIFQTSYLKYLKSEHPNIKLVLYMQDLICRNAKLDFEACRDSFDLILSYDRGDAEKYGLAFHSTPMSVINVPSDPLLDKSDIYFCGFAKTRFPIIHELYRKYTDMGLKCDFHIMQFPDNEEKVDGIQYDENILTYEQNIQHVLNTKAVLEIMQEGADGFTPRVWESIIYDRHLLTNNGRLCHSGFYDERFMHESDASDIGRLIDCPVSYSDEQKRQLSPVHLLEYIDSLLP